MVPVSPVDALGILRLSRRRPTQGPRPISRQGVPTGAVPDIGHELYLDMGCANWGCPRQGPRTLSGQEVRHHGLELQNGLVTNGRDKRTFAQKGSSKA